MRHRRRLMRANAFSTGSVCSSCSSPPSGSRISSLAGSPFGPDAIGERHQRLHGAGDVCQRGDDLALRVFDTLPDFTFLVRLQQPALANVLEVDTDEVDILAGYPAGLGCLFRPGRRRGLRPRCRGWADPQTPRARPRAGARPGSWMTAIWIGLFALLDGQAELLSPVPPVEHMGLPRRIGPLDERLAGPSRFESEGVRARCFLRHLEIREPARLLPSRPTSI